MRFILKYVLSLIKYVELNVNVTKSIRSVITKTLENITMYINEIKQQFVISRTDFQIFKGNEIWLIKAAHIHCSTHGTYKNSYVFISSQR